MDIDLATWKRLAESRLEDFNNKAERTAFLIGLSLGARATDDHERLRCSREMAALYNIELEPKSKRPSLTTVRKARINPANVQLDNNLASELAALMRGN